MRKQRGRENGKKSAEVGIARMPNKTYSEKDAFTAILGLHA
jgi:hypothetical protein